jgi:phosphatidate cytidylyltransferase
VFVGCVFAGHIYVCFLVAFVEFLLVSPHDICLWYPTIQSDSVFQFRELVRVRYNAFFHTIQDTIPLFRTTQWLWFAVAIVYTYSDFVFEIITNNQDLHHMQSWAQYYTSISFLLYSGTFVLTIATMQVGHIKFQLNQLSWTMLVIALTVGQLKYIMHNVYNGLYWFALPILLVVTNDIMAYVSGMACGRKFIRYPFISFSPNKTWEGFIGGAFFTLIISWYLSAYLSKFKWMTCPTNKFLLRPSHLDCELDPIFQHAHSYFSPQLFELLPSVLVKTIPGVVEKCSVGDTGVVTACISGEPSHHHHHFELVVKNVLPAQIHALALAVFASFVAPFGGFLASAIKRAYGIKDFDSIIPGHGGVMDRFDCQLLMALCVWVYYNTFIKTSMMSVAKLVYMFKQLSPQDKAAFIEAIKIGRNHQLEDFLN